MVIKVIRRDLLTNPLHVRRFEREAKLAAQLSHPNVVTVYEAEKAGPLQFLVMEFLEGKDLGRLVTERGPLPVAKACDWVRQAAVGLEYLHERGMVHRDIKPSNLFLTTEGRVKILDLGLACLRVRSGVDASAELTLQGQVFGTVGFCSPEQLEQSSDVDIRSDIYSLGCTLYHLLAGQPPFASSANLIEHVLAHRQAPVPPIRETRSDVPEALDRVLNRMLAKDPEDRYSTPAQVADALAPFASPTTSSASVEVPLPAARAKRRGKWPALAGVAVVALLAAAVVYWLTGRPGAEGQGAAAGGVPIKIGILHSRTGTMALIERPVIDATLFSIEEINTAGGVKGRRVEAVVEDGQSDPATFAEKAEKLTSEVAIEPVAYPDTRSQADWDAFVTNLQLGWGGQWANPKR